MISINPSKETKKIINFIQDLRKKTGLKDIVIGWSGGIDSTVCLYLLARALPKENIHVLHMPYGTSCINELTSLRVKGLKIHEKNIHEISIKKAVDNVWRIIREIGGVGEIRDIKEIEEKVRLGNIMARVRMIMLFDFAKKVKGLVCGTENKTEHLLGYFTRYGDGASDLEPIQHLFKTQVFELAKYLGVSDSIIKKPPSANLWDGQTDEGEFGFTYGEADEVLSEIREFKGIIREYKGMIRECEGMVREDKGEIREYKGKIREKIMERVRRNKFKREVPYTL